MRPYAWFALPAPSGVVVMAVGVHAMRELTHSAETASPLVEGRRFASPAAALSSAWQTTTSMCVPGAAVHTCPPCIVAFLMPFTGPCVHESFQSSLCHLPPYVTRCCVSQLHELPRTLTPRNAACTIPSTELFNNSCTAKCFDGEARDPATGDCGEGAAFCLRPHNVLTGAARG